MDFNYRRFDTQNHYDNVFPTSSLNYSYSDHPMIHVADELRGERTLVPPVILVQPLRSYHPLEPEMRLHGERFTPYDVTVPVAREELYGGGGYYDHRRHIREFEAVPVPVHRLPPSPEVQEIVMLPKPTSANASGSKRKAPSPFSSPTVPSSSGFVSKKVTEQWRCAVCDITATSEHGLNDHLAGKKHQAKVESLKSNNTGGDIGLGLMKTSTRKKQTPEVIEVKSLKGNNSGGTGGGDIGLGVTKSVSNDSKKVKKSGGGKMRKKYKFWCKMCQTGAYDEVVMRDHKKGKKHLKNLRMKAQARAQRKSDD